MTATQHDRTKARYFVPAFVGGWLIIAFGVQSALAHDRDAHPFSLLVFIVVFDIGHDAIIAPVVIVGAWLIDRFVPKIGRGPIRLAGCTTVIFVAFAYPLVRRWGQRPTNSSTLPLEYGRNLAIVLAIVWVTAAAVIIGRVVRGRSGRAGAGALAVDTDGADA